jgi:hypothetical protein
MSHNRRHNEYCVTDDIGWGHIVDVTSITLIQGF